MAKRLINRDYHGDTAMESGVITFTNVDDSGDVIKHDIAALIGGGDVWNSLSPYGKWSVMRDANNSLGDSFSADAGTFKETSKIKYDRFAIGEMGRVGGGTGGTVGMNDNVLALMKVTGRGEEECLEKWHGLSADLNASGEAKTEENADSWQSEQDDWKNHDSMKAARHDLRTERAKAKQKALKAKAASAPALEF